MLVTGLPPSMEGIVTAPVGLGEMAGLPMTPLQISVLMPSLCYVHV